MKINLTVVNSILEREINNFLLEKIEQHLFLKLNKNYIRNYVYEIDEKFDEKKGLFELKKTNVIIVFISPNYNINAYNETLIFLKRKKKEGILILCVFIREVNLEEIKEAGFKIFETLYKDYGLEMPKERDKHLFFDRLFEVDKVSSYQLNTYYKNLADFILLSVEQQNSKIENKGNINKNVQNNNLNFEHDAKKLKINKIKLELSKTNIVGLVILTFYGVLGTIFFAIIYKTNSTSYLSKLELPTFAKLIVFTSPFILALASWGEQSLGVETFLMFKTNKDKTPLINWIKAILGKMFSPVWFTRVTLLIFPIMITAGIIGLRLKIFPQDWSEYANSIGWLGYCGAGIFLGVVSMIKTEFLIGLLFSIKFEAKTILGLFFLDLAATSFFLTVGLSSLLWIWENKVEMLLGNKFLSSFDLQTILWNTFDRIYLPIWAATFAPCLLLLILFIILLFNSFFSFLSSISAHFDPKKHPLTSPIVGLILISSIIVPTIGIVVSFAEYLI